MAETSIGAIALIGALIGAVPAILGVVIPWVRSRDLVARSNREVELAKNRVEFMENWLKAKHLSSTPEEYESLKVHMGQQLDGILESLGAALTPDPTSVGSVTPSPRARRYRTFFYVTSGFYVFLIFGSSIDEQENSTFPQLMKELQNDTGLYVFFLLPVVVSLILWLRAKRGSR